MPYSDQQLCTIVCSVASGAYVIMQPGKCTATPIWYICTSQWKLRLEIIQGLIAILYVQQLSCDCILTVTENSVK